MNAVYFMLPVLPDQRLLWNTFRLAADATKIEASGDGRDIINTWPCGAMWGNVPDEIAESWDITRDNTWLDWLLVKSYPENGIINRGSLYLFRRGEIVSRGSLADISAQMLRVLLCSGTRVSSMPVIATTIDVNYGVQASGGPLSRIKSGKGSVCRVAIKSTVECGKQSVVVAGRDCLVITGDGSSVSGDAGVLVYGGNDSPLQGETCPLNAHGGSGVSGVSEDMRGEHVNRIKEAVKGAWVSDDMTVFVGDGSTVFVGKSSHVSCGSCCSVVAGENSRVLASTHCLLSVVPNTEVRAGFGSEIEVYSIDADNNPLVINQKVIKKEDSFKYFKIDKDGNFNKVTG